MPLSVLGPPEVPFGLPPLGSRVLLPIVPCMRPRPALPVAADPPLTLVPDLCGTVAPEPPACANANVLVRAITVAKEIVLSFMLFSVLVSPANRDVTQTFLCKSCNPRVPEAGLPKRNPAFTGVPLR